jgi:hypothetical protein
VKTEHGCIIEFQHSFLPAEERRARETFYPRMVWVVDGLRRKRDSSQFFKALSSGLVVREKPLTFSIPAGMGALLQDWVDSRVPVFFDFGAANIQMDISRFGALVLWYLDPNSPDGWAHLAPVRRVSFIDALLHAGPFEGIDYSKKIELARRIRKLAVFLPYHRGSRRATGFRQDMVRKHRARSRRHM